METQTLLNILYVGLIILVATFLIFLGMVIFALFRLIWVLKRIQVLTRNAQFLAQSAGLLRNRFKMGVFSFLEMIISAFLGKGGDKKYG